MDGAARIAVATPAAGPGLDAQTRAPEDVFTGPDALARAHAAGASWIWVLEAGAVPRPDALERLVAAQAPPGAAGATLIAGAVVDDAGRVRDAAVPGFRIERPDVIELAGRGLLPIRHAPLAHCLVAREALTRHGFPDTARFGPYAAQEWSARVLRDADGYFDASSVVVSAAANGRPGPRDAPALARMLRSGAWSRGDQLAALSRILRRD